MNYSSLILLTRLTVLVVGTATVEVYLPCGTASFKINNANKILLSATKTSQYKYVVGKILRVIIHFSH